MRRKQLILLNIMLAVVLCLLIGLFAAMMDRESACKAETSETTSLPTAKTEWTTGAVEETPEGSKHTEETKVTEEQITTGPTEAKAENPKESTAEPKNTEPQRETTETSPTEEGSKEESKYGEISGETPED